MASRDRYTADTKCPECGEKGILHVSEDDYPFMKKLHRAVDGVEGNLTATMSGETDIKVTCNKCGHIYID